MVAQGNGPHVVIFPYDEHGHVTPSFALGRALTRVGIQVTGVLTATRYARVASIASADRTPLFDIVAIPDSAEAGSSKQDDVCYQQSMQHLEPGLEELMLRLQPRPSCLMSDILFPWSQDIADRLHIPRFHICTFPAIIPLVLSYTPALYARGLLPYRPEMENELVDFIPGLPKLFKLCDVPNDFRSRDRQQLEFLFEIMKGMKRAAGAIINTVYELEPEVVQSLVAKVGLIVYTLGSMSSLELDAPEACHLSCTVPGPANGCSTTECLEWLNVQPLASVVYVALGSIVSFTEEEVQEMALGLEASGQPFLWVLRQPPGGGDGKNVQVDLMSALPDGFLERNRERGRVISWAPQTAVLAHPSLGCFLTHCGMASLLEALSAGVPMIGGFCKISDQNTNLRLLSQEWEVAIPLSSPMSHQNIPLSSRVACCVKEVLHGERGRTLRRNALAMKSTLGQAVSAPHGSSYLNLIKLAHAVINACAPSA
ncbi:hypothetical protein GOP47_0016195 [Adiantum capillus-veneris]|uniref:Glycosyltransferase n=1 Tax=Adiantum capillus-veneris TaxID=13818 RepID=A0A9D4UH82_ADICA|nr:hypothetical protein GOP47_0016195 [Adiantum capillus-veneris]